MMSLNIIFILTNSVDPDEMLHHLGLHYLPNYLHEGIQNEKVLQTELINGNRPFNRM